MLTDIESIKRKTIILTQTDPQKDMVFDAWKNAGIDAAVIFREMPKPLRFIRRLWADHFFPGYALWYGEWKDRLSKYDTVIVHADIRTRTVPGWIRKKYPEIRVIYWYWNPVNKNSYPWLTRLKDIECWSFDPDDCEKYHMNRNIQYYYDDYGETDPNDAQHEEKYSDVYFVGRDKGRMDTIDRIRKELNRYGYTTNFDVIKDGESGIPYKEAKRRTRLSDVILEVTQNGQSGCTLRALEALFLGKKLITTNKKIVNEDFYNKSNIFIYGQDEDLAGFMKRSYDACSEVYKSRHTIEAWLLHFFETEEA